MKPSENKAAVKTVLPLLQRAPSYLRDDDWTRDDQVWQKALADIWALAQVSYAWPVASSERDELQQWTVQNPKQGRIL